MREKEDKRQKKREIEIARGKEIQTFQFLSDRQQKVERAKELKLNFEREQEKIEK